MQEHSIINDETLQDIESFVESMVDRRSDLPTYDDGTPRDDECSGEYGEWELAEGVVLVCDWAYLDAPSTSILVNPETATNYNDSGETLLGSVHRKYNEMVYELSEAFEMWQSQLIFERDETNSTDSYDCWSG